jgi:hypothetical protein
MFQNLVLGSGLVTLSVIIHTAGLIAVGWMTPLLARGLGFHQHDVGRTLVMAGMVLGILSLLTLEVWSWAIAYAAVHATGSFADALFLSTTSFSTLGYGAVVFDPAWRLLTALEGINGFLLIGWSTAFLVRASTRHGPFRSDDHF